MVRLKWLMLASLLIAVAILPLTFWSYKEFYVKPFLENAPPHLKPYVDYEPFFSTIYGHVAIIAWASLAAVWFYAALKRLKKHLKTPTA